jgi:DNA-binding response OmpR family regulator
MKKKVLIADDNSNIRFLLHQFLTNEYDVKTFADGSEVINWMQEGNMPDLVISDIMMPEIGGWDLLKNMKNSLFFKNVPVLILSGVDKSEERIKYLNAGADEFMVKPFSPLELNARISKLINK